MKDSDDRQREVEFDRVIDVFGAELAEEPVRMIGACLRESLEPFADKGVVDQGMGFGEYCLDFWRAGRAMRVVVSRVPELDRGECG